MAIYGNMTWTNGVEHCVAESSNLKATIVGNIYDVIVRDDADETIAVDNGMAILVGEFTGDGLQTRYAKLAADTDKIALVLSVPTVKDGTTKGSEAPTNFYNKKGAVARAYEVVEEDIFGVSKNFVEGDVVVGAYVVWDSATQKYKVSATDPSATNGFVAKVHSIQVGSFYDLVRLFVIQNKDVA